ncbi:UpxY family transcription antiterminator [Maribacter flavus]|uniref:UpxY family transcription antiterminator n=1 Tax=Maribacter flavus TaxID=1658664 RepID=A0A5B2TN13_9FLAO|nr:UpxY family transcription antiterminator [Maribacter flavus]KAA2215786.1 UpxY family transcription antiterminator [Maribacter flavus]
MNTNQSGWHVLYVKSRWEKKVFDSLEEISLKAFLPRIKVINQWKDRKKAVHKPLFSSYVFVYIKSSLEFYKALSIDGACAYIRFGNEYATVREKEIEHIRLLIGDKEITNIETGVKMPKIGDYKKILFGPLKGLECEVLKADNYGKIFVQINSLRQNIMATVPLHHLEEVLT